MLVSVILTNYNYSKFLSKCIDSVINQTYKNIEIIIIDDCSTDNSQNIILEYKEKHHNILTIFNSKNLGVINARNVGIDMSNGEYLCFLDADDYWDKNKINLQLNLTLQYDLSFCDMFIIDEFNNISSVKTHKNSFDIYNFKTLLKYNFIPHSSLMLKKSILSDIRYREIPKTRFSDKICNLFSVRRFIHEDYDFLLRLYKFNNPNTRYINKKLIFYRKHSNSFSTGLKKKIFSVLFIFNNSLNYNLLTSIYYTFRISFFSYIRKISN